MGGCNSPIFDDGHYRGWQAASPIAHLCDISTCGLGREGSLTSPMAAVFRVLNVDVEASWGMKAQRYGEFDAERDTEAFTLCRT